MYQRMCGSCSRWIFKNSYMMICDLKVVKDFNFRPPPLARSVSNMRLCAVGSSRNNLNVNGTVRIADTYSRTYVSRKSPICSTGTFFSRNSQFSLQNSRCFCQTSVNNLAVHASVENQGILYRVLNESTPVLCAQDLWLYAHDVSGLPWWATIVLSTVVLRATVTFPLALYQHYITAKLENLQLELKEISKEMGRETSIAVKHFKWTEKHAKAVYIISMKKQWKKMIERENCHPAKAFLLVLVQVPMWVSLSLALRNLVFMLPVPDTAAQVTLLELSVGGSLWFHNLVLPDSSWILPIMMGFINLSIIELQNLARTKEAGRFHKVATNIFRGVSLGMIPIAAAVPSCLSLYWVTSSVLGLIQNLVVLSPRLRHYVGIPETQSMPKQPYKHMYAKVAGRLASLRRHSQPPPTS